MDRWLRKRFKPEFILQLAPGTPALTGGALTGPDFRRLGISRAHHRPGPFTVNFVFEAGGTDVERLI